MYHARRGKILSIPHEAWVPAGRPSKAGAFNERRFNLGPKNVIFGKTHFGDPIIDARIFELITKTSIPVAAFLCFVFITMVLKNKPKTVPQNFTFASENGQKPPNE